jgi:hypothetical protein
LIDGRNAHERAQKPCAEDRTNDSDHEVEKSALLASALSASIRALQPVDSENESTQWQNDR